jgi:uncharacterized membrane protein (UPF0127 family)
MDTARIVVDGHPFEVWLATTPEERRLGLMRVTEDKLAAIPSTAGQGAPDIQRGMLFIFEWEQPLSFWMRNTIIPLDILYISSDGRVVSRHTMAPLETRTYPSGTPARFALEMKAGLADELGLDVGDRIEIPEAVLKGTGE